MRDETQRESALGKMMLSAVYDLDEADEEREIQAHQIERFLKSTPKKHPKVKVLTADGVIGKYGVLFDNKTGDVRLVITEDETMLPTPGTLEKH